MTSKKSANPNYEDWENILIILKYLNSTKNYGIKFTKIKLIEAYTDADYVGDLITRRSTS